MLVDAAAASYTISCVVDNVKTVVGIGLLRFLSRGRAFAVHASYAKKSCQLPVDLCVPVCSVDMSFA